MTCMNNASFLHSRLPVSQNLTLASPRISEGCRPDILVQTSCDKLHMPFLVSMRHCLPIIEMKIHKSIEPAVDPGSKVCLCSRPCVYWLRAALFKYTGMKKQL